MSATACCPDRLPEGRPSVDEQLDRAIRQVRSATTGTSAPGTGERTALAVRVPDVLDRVPDQRGVHDDVHVGGPGARQVPVAVADEQVTALESALDTGHPRGRPGPELVAVAWAVPLSPVLS